MSPYIKFAVTSTNPHLPFRDETFGFVYAGSVFTHIGDLADAWLLELHRCLSNDGHAYLTFNDTESLKILQAEHPDLPDWQLYKTHVADQSIAPNDYYSVSLEVSPYSRIYYNRSLLRTRLEQIFEVKGIFDKGFGWQSVYLLAPKHI